MIAAPTPKSLTKYGGETFMNVIVALTTATRHRDAVSQPFGWDSTALDWMQLVWVR